MNSVIREKLESLRAEIRRLCKCCHVRHLGLFGSATLDRFDPKNSDLDFLVGFQDGFTTLDNYLALAEGLEDLFERCLIHGYDSVDDEIVWRVIQEKLPLLLQQAEALLARPDSPKSK